MGVVRKNENSFPFICAIRDFSVFINHYEQLGGQSQVPLCSTGARISSNTGRLYPFSLDLIGNMLDKISITMFKVVVIQFCMVK